MSDLRITHTDRKLTTWVELEGHTYGVTFSGSLVDQDGAQYGVTQNLLIGNYLELNGFTEAAKEFANNQRSHHEH
tara:strand:- start:143 stop:367 length:225 start_codon:yes stop_codon:yes gene_type:complete